jgi:GT2 family glycosyltransferase
MALSSDPCLLPSIEGATPGSRLALWSWDTQDAAAPPVDVSVVVVTWNSARWIDRCLNSIPAAVGALSFEAIVHDNASSDGTAEIVAGSKIQGLRLERGGENLGFAGGVNAAAARSRGHFILLLSPDCKLEPGSLETLVGALRTDPGAAGAVPLLIGDDGLAQREFQLRRLPTLATFVSELLFADKLWPSNPVSSRYRYAEASVDELKTVEQPAAAALMLRREVFERLGGFDERFVPAWFEDVDYCRRMAGVGLRILFVISARVTHHGGASLDHLDLRQFLRIWYRNLFRYAEKWFAPAEVETLRWVIIGGMLLRCAASLLGFRRGQVVNSYRAYAEVARDAFHRWNSPSRSF